MQVFFSQQIEAPYLYLTEEEAKHCVQVLRKKQGDVIHIIDGLGGFYKGEILNLHKKEVQIKILEQKFESKMNFDIHIALATPKQTEKFEWFLQKATEIGISEITPIQSLRTERKKLRLDRMEKILISAIKQSKRARLPKLNGFTPFSKFLDNNLDGAKLIGHCDCPPTESLIYVYKKHEIFSEKKVTVLIGPEGDFTLEEVEKAKEKGFLEITFGEMRLKTETAGILACHSLHLLSQMEAYEKN